MISTSNPVDAGTHLQTSSKDGNLSVMAMADLKQNQSNDENQDVNYFDPKPCKEYAFITFPSVPGTQAPVSVSTGDVISGCGRNVLLLGRVVGISDHEKLLQRQADYRNTYTTQVNGDIVMNDGMAISSELNPQ